MLSHNRKLFKNNDLIYHVIFCQENIRLDGCTQITTLENGNFVEESSNIRDLEMGELFLVKHYDQYKTPFKLNMDLVVIKRQLVDAKVSLSMDFTFNKLRSVKKISHKASEKPWYEETKPGLNWFAYCMNVRCIINQKLFALNKGFGEFYLQTQIKTIKCPVCSNDLFSLRNIGFIDCSWQIRAVI